MWRAEEEGADNTEAEEEEGEEAVMVRLDHLSIETAVTEKSR